MKYFRLLVLALLFTSMIFSMAGEVAKHHQSHSSESNVTQDSSPSKIDHFAHSPSSRHCEDLCHNGIPHLGHSFFVTSTSHYDFLKSQIGIALYWDSILTHAFPDLDSFRRPPKSC